MSLKANVIDDIPDINLTGVEGAKKTKTKEYIHR